MRRWNLGLVILCIIMCFAGCQKNEEQGEVLPISREKFLYKDIENVDRIAVDNDGVLYTVCSELPEYKVMQLTEAEIPQAVHKICIYDVNGVCTRQIEFELGNGTIDILEEHDNKLYFVLPCIAEYVTTHELFVLDIASEQVTELAVLSGFDSISEMVWLGDYIYMLGRYRHVDAKEYELHPDILYYDYGGEKICRFNPNNEETKIELMNVEFPIAIYRSKNDTLMIYCYTEEQGFRFFEFNQNQGNMTELGGESTYCATKILSACEEGYLYIVGKDLYYGTVEGTYAQISPEAFQTVTDMKYVKGFVYYAGEEVGRFCVADVMRKNQTIEVLVPELTSTQPYGCGFNMESTLLPQEQFSLKVLSLDTDFDLYLLSTREQCAYNLYEKGAFYALNEVEGVQEYLNACFPYLEKLAYNEEGDIWMLPVELEIPMLVYNREYCTENQIDISKMDYMEFLSFTEKIKKTEPEKSSISFYVAVEQMFAMYLEKFESFDTQDFRKYAQKLQEIYQSQGEWTFDFFVNQELFDGRIPKVYYEYNIYADNLRRYSEKVTDSDILGTMNVPKMFEENSNVGTLTLIAVNPESENLKATLEYISAYAKYMVTKQDSYLLKDKSMYSDTPFSNDCYEVYAGGNIRFSMDTEVYMETFNEYILGNIDLETVIVEMERRRKLYLEE